MSELEELAQLFLKENLPNFDRIELFEYNKNDFTITT